MVTEIKKILTSFCGCEKYTSSLSQEVYFRYRSNEGHDDKLMNTIDSLVLYDANASKLLIHFALESQTYPVTYNSRLEQLAFKQLNRDAILYLRRVYAKKYQSQIKSALLSYLLKTDFSKTGTTDYFDVVSELLKYEDQTVNKAIITKLKSDAWWKHDYGKFYGLFGEYNLEKTLPAY